MKSEVVSWIFGIFGVSVFFGIFATFYWNLLLCKLLGIEQKVKLSFKIPLEVSGILIGIVERIFFTIAIATDMGGTAIAMVVWITVKIQMVWKMFTKEQDLREGVVSLLSSIGSMIIAIIGAKICNVKLW